ncbi:uncharacterized protein LOC106711489 isoform X2 [Papilio machaon]|uniref:uncharacterized protein LOC106711489 isoform X2 n=1 Tax=Papilio machaon TaxID=76193 RepID=UPI001E6640CE|nr:uncharacterized protein LOC106711489 isoform X2 [Papilio machaon]
MKTRLDICFFFACCILVRVAISDTLEDFRTRRQINSIPLVFPYGGTYKLLIGMAAPIHNEDHVNLAFGINFQYQYVQFQNVSELSQYYFIKTVSREQRNLELKERSDERLVFYKAAADMLQIPDYGRSPFEGDTEWYDMMSPYIDAAVAGRQMFNCASIYTNCPEGQGVLELISILRNE